MSNILDLTKENIQQVVDASAEHIVVMTFSSQQQPESVGFAQEMETIAAENTSRFILAKVNCDEQMEIAQYFQIQALPTTLLLSKGQPIDGFAGVKPRTEVLEVLEKHLPAKWMLALKQAKSVLANEERTADELNQAFELLKQAYQDSQVAEVTLALADVNLLLGNNTEAETLLQKIGLADQDSYYQSLMAKLDLAKDAADTPKIRELQIKLDTNPGDFDALISLGKALHQVQRNEEALELLYSVLRKDLSAQDGNVKTVFMEILTAIGQGNPLANQYRRKLYTLLY
ncbi:tetratricopeptide repeat protein [Shewanella sp. 202IG2-18]|uniref:tetratricopeptide repeat protein n=1 Tax=Parashewanella hymeniacidonis TaxID=2807618 RepID=UPI001961A407|nr:tetratricopeptide repeat protein [Parashewanella hymeniacidonis]MBM7073334.1 tetratricopeptide repeat protein [Parashewanella hymeniacidonis]